MSGIHLYHPESVPTEELRMQLKMRLPAVDFEQLNREQLVKTFKSFATPIHKRFKHSHPTNDTEQSNQFPGSQRTIHLKQRAESNVERLTDACKRIKFSGPQVEETISRKRPHEGDIQMTSIDQSPTQMKRQKITWP